MRLKVPYFFDNNEKDVAFHQPKLLLTRGFIKKIFLIFIKENIMFLVTTADTRFWDLNQKIPLEFLN